MLIHFFYVNIRIWCHSKCKTENVICIDIYLILPFYENIVWSFYCRLHRIIYLTYWSTACLRIHMQESCWPNLNSREKGLNNHPWKWQFQAGCNRALLPCWGVKSGVWRVKTKKRASILVTWPLCCLTSNVNKRQILLSNENARSPNNNVFAMASHIWSL